MSNLTILIQDPIGSPNLCKKAREEKETKGGMWRRLSASPFGFTPGSKFLPTSFLLFIKLIFSYASDNTIFVSNIRQKIPTQIHYIFYKYIRIILCGGIKRLEKSPLSGGELV